MALAKHNLTPAENQVTRRTLLCAAPAAGFAALAGAGAAASVADQVMQHVREIERLLRDAALENVELSGFRWNPQDDDFIANGRWLNPRSEWDCRPAHFRPRYRPSWWVQEPPRILGTMHAAVPSGL